VTGIKAVRKAVSILGILVIITSFTIWLVVSYVRDNTLYTVLVVVLVGLGFNTPFLTMVVLPLSQFLVVVVRLVVLCLG
jgi:hypothetical protein